MWTHSWHGVAWRSSHGALRPWVLRALALLALHRYDNNCNGCQCAGLTVWCTSTATESPWNNWRTNVMDWVSYGSATNK